MRKRYGKKKPVSPHILHYPLSANCVKKGISTRALQTLLGHDRLTTIEIYLNLSPEDAIREFSRGKALVSKELNLALSDYGFAEESVEREDYKWCTI